MTARERVAATRRSLGMLLGARALGWGAAVLAVALAAAALAAAAGGDAALVRALRVAGVVAAMATTAALLAGARRTLAPARVALWIEERVPALEWSLVTALEGGLPAGTAGRLERRVAAVPVPPLVRPRVLPALRAPAVVLGVALAVLLAAPAAGRATARLTGGPGGARTAPDRAAAGARALEALEAEVRAPAYSGRAARTLRDPVRVDGLVGSRVTVSGAGSPDGVRAEVDGRALTPAAAGGRWAVAFALGEAPGVLRLRAGTAQRLVTLEPVPDSVPAVVLAAPARDTVYRVPEGSLALRADVRDDIGLAGGVFEYIVSAGEGESFTFRAGTLGAATFGNARAGVMRATLELARLELKPGDIVHLRAVARDGRTPGGPGVGSSETRTLRVARAGEYDSVAVEGAPPPEADKSLISQRMLIILTEALDRRRPRLEREALRREARAISRDQSRLRKQVGDIIFARLGNDPTGEHSHDDGHDHSADTLPAGKLTAEQLLKAADAATNTGAEVLDFEGDETPVVAINRPLLEAYNHMWDASRELDQGDTRRALPPMRLALEAIQRARAAERLYLRGKPPSVVVDVERVRLAGKDTGRTSARVPRAPADPEAAARTRRFLAAVAGLRSAPEAAIDSLVLLRVEVLPRDAQAAGALGDALEALRAGRDATGALLRARRLLEGSARTRPGLPAWGGGAP